MADIIKHKGIVEQIEEGHIVVRIVQTSACSSCSDKGLCNASESKEKLIDIYDRHVSCRIGEEVMVCGTTSMGMQAVLLAFGLPLLLMLIALFVTMRITDGDALWSALVAFLVIVPYYFLLHLLKDKINKTFTFTIEKQQ